MKKILFLLLICVIKLSAYEYLFMSNPNHISGYPSSNRWFVDPDGKLMAKIENFDGYIKYGNLIYQYFNYIKNGNNLYINSDEFKNIYLNDLVFLNDLYTQATNIFLNYLYNKNQFGNTNYIQYDNYEILYNDDGLAVESIVDGVWAGLYDDSQKSKSGAMYNKNGSMVYYNGKEVIPVTSFLVWLQKFTNRVVIETFEEIQRSLISGIIAAVVLVLAIVRLVLELLPSSITPRRRRYYGGGRGSLPDFGDGRQVSVSVRARLAAKNQALKARAYDRSGVEESTVNGILFDLENDR